MHKFVGVMNGELIWEIDYQFGRGIAEYIGQRVTYDDLKINNNLSQYVEYEHSIYDFLLEYGFEAYKKDIDNQGDIAKIYFLNKPVDKMSMQNLQNRKKLRKSTEGVKA